MVCRIGGKHTTFVTGLKELLPKLEKSSLFTLCTPGRIYVKGAPTMPSTARHGLVLRFTTDDATVRNNNIVSYKVLAKHKSKTQELFLVCKSGSSPTVDDASKHLQQLLGEYCTVETRKSKKSPWMLCFRLNQLGVTANVWNVSSVRMNTQASSFWCTPYFVTFCVNNVAYESYGWNAIRLLAKYTYFKTLLWSNLVEKIV